MAKLIKVKDYLLLVDEEAEIKAGSYYITNLGNIYKETERLFEEDEGVERFSSRSVYKPILAYYPLSKEAKELDLPLLPNPFEDNFNDLEWNDIADEDWKSRAGEGDRSHFMYRQGYIHGAYKALQTQSKQFSLEDMKKAIEMAREMKDDEGIFDVHSIRGLTEVCTYDWEERYSEKEIIQSLSTQQLPKEFIPEYDSIPNFIRSADNIQEDYRRILKTITNSEGKEELVGTWKF